MTHADIPCHFILVECFKVQFESTKLSVKIITANKYLSVRFSCQLLHLFSLVVFTTSKTQPEGECAAEVIRFRFTYASVKAIIPIVPLYRCTDLTEAIYEYVNNEIVPRIVTTPRGPMAFPYMHIHSASIIFPLEVRRENSFPSSLISSIWIKKEIELFNESEGERVFFFNRKKKEERSEFLKQRRFPIS